MPEIERVFRLFSLIAVVVMTAQAAWSFGQGTVTTVASVPASNFRSASVPTSIDPSIKPGALWDARGSLDFRAANLPAMVPAAKARHMVGDEYVLGTTVNGESRAYPIRFL